MHHLSNSETPQRGRLALEPLLFLEQHWAWCAVLPYARGWEQKYESGCFFYAVCVCSLSSSPSQKETEFRAQWPRWVAVLTSVSLLLTSF